MTDTYYTVLRCVTCGQHWTPLVAFTREVHPGRCDCGGSFVVASMVLAPEARDVTDGQKTEVIRS